MTKSDLLSLARVYIPEAPSTVVSDANVLIILNNAAQEFVERTDALPTFSDFDITSDTIRYALSTVVPTYLRMRKEGIWWYDNSDTRWDQIDSTTGAEMNRRYSTWLNDTAGRPQRSWIEGDFIYVHPKGDDTDDDIRIYHYAKSTDMSDDSHYPFTGSTTQYSWLAPYEKDLLDYYKARVLIDVLGGTKITKGQYFESKFYSKCEEVKRKLQYRADLIPFTKSRRPASMQPMRNLYVG